MLYVALLRGINVGGKNKVEMPKLKLTFERLGLVNIKTYINSGNIIFRDETRSQSELTALLEDAIKEDFSLSIKVLLRDYKNIQAVVNALPDSWVNNAEMKCDVMFLWEHFDSENVLKQVVIKPEIDDVAYVPGAILWRVDKAYVTKSGLMKIVGSELYKHMTIRNCNTTRKIYELMQK